jgi:hypothetical protein
MAAYEIIREENFDPENPNRIRFKRDFSALAARSHVVTTETEEFENYEVAHFRLLTDTNFLPYGRSIIEPARKVWKQITLMEDAMLIHRIMRAPDKRLFKIDIGNIPPNEVDAYMEGMINRIKKIPFVDPETGQYNLKYNMMNLLEDFYFPVRGGESATSIENISGIQYDSIPDIEYLKARLLGALKIPKAFLGFEEDISGKSTLAAQDFRFARTVERIQRIIVSELYKIAIVHLYSQGFDDESLVDFELNLTVGSTVYDKERAELYATKVTLAGDMMEKKLFSRQWIYENLFNMTEDQYLKEQERMVQDYKIQFRLEQIKTEGNDPVKTGMSFGTPHDLAALYKGNSGVPKGYDEKAPEGGWPGAGRPEEPGTYGTHEHPLGWDPIGRKSNRHVSESHTKLIEDMKSDALKQTLGKKTKKNQSTLLSEANILKD